MLTYKTAKTMFVALIFCVATTVLADDPVGSILASLGMEGGVDALMANQDLMQKAQSELANAGTEVQEQVAKMKAAVEGGDTLENVAKQAMSAAPPEKMAELAAQAQAKYNITTPASMKDMDHAAMKAKLEETVKGATIPPNVIKAAESLNAKPAEKPAEKPVGKPIEKPKKSSKTKKAGKSSKDKSSKKVDTKSKADPKKKSG